MSQNGKGETFKYIALAAFLASLFIINASFPVDPASGKISSKEPKTTINSLPAATINLDVLKLLATNIEAIKKNEDYPSKKSTSIYFQRVWTPVSKLKDPGPGPEMFIGEFISSKKIINTTEPIELLESLSLNPNYGLPDNIMFQTEDKASDTLYLYVEYNSRPCEQHRLQPIAALSLDGKVSPLGEYLLDQKYLTKKFQLFLDDINIASAQYLETLEQVNAIKR